MTRPILVFGAKGQVGQELMALARARGEEAIGFGREVDIRDAAAVLARIVEHGPRFIVNAAAYTAVDKAESEAELANAVNATGARVVAEAAAARDIPVLQISTDYVFDGTKHGAYVEEDAMAPLGVYGRSKAAGEIAVRGAAARYVILRTAWVYGRFGGNFLKTMLRLAGERDRLRVVADQHGCPTATADIAAAILAVDAGLAKNPAISGRFHFAGTGVTTWHGFAEAIVAAQADHTGRTPPVEPISTADYPLPARRPANAALDSTRFADTFGYRAQDWRVRTKEVVAALLGVDRLVKGQL